MKLTCNFESLLNSLSPVSFVVEDALSSDDMKNVIFKVSSDGRVVLLGINPLITYKRILENCSVVAEEGEYNENGVFFMQIKCKELISFLNAFKSMRKTQAEDVIMETFRNKVRATVVERDMDTNATHTSDWTFENIPIKPVLHGKINLVFPEENVQSVATENFAKYAFNLLPIMQNGGTNMYSKLTFGVDRVVAFNPSFVVLLYNDLPDIFKGITLSYRAVSFLKDIVCAVPSVDCNRTNESICFKTESFEAFVGYGTKDVAEYKPYIDRYDESKGIALDRKYFKDVLKRLSIGNDKICFTIDNETKIVEVSSSKFHQEITPLNIRGFEDVGKLTFKTMPDVINKMIIGDDGVFEERMYMFFTPNKSGGFTLNISDRGQAWFSTASVH